MPFKSKAQRRKFAELLMKGEISEEPARSRKAAKRSAKGGSKKAARKRRTR